MLKIFLIFVILTSPLFAIRIDPSSKSFELQEKKQRDLFDFSGEYPELEKINIDARRKMRVELMLTGVYPVLKSINYEGSFGSLDGALTGSFPLLEEISILSNDALMKLDFSGKWEKSCHIKILSGKADVIVILPKDVALLVNTKTGPTSKVTNELLDKKRGLHWMNKTFFNDLYKNGDRDVVLEFTIETAKANIVLK